MKKLIILILFFILSIGGGVGNARGENDEVPFGVNDAFASSKVKSSDYLKDLGVRWISDHLPRRKIEKVKKGKIKYDFRVIDKRLKEYGAKAKLNAWFIINVESKFQFEDGKIVGTGGGRSKSQGKYIPDGPISYDAYGRYLKALVNYMNSKVPNWKVKYWSIDNEHSSLFVSAFCEGQINRECGRQAARAYAGIVEYSYKVIKEIDPQAKIVFGGPGSILPDEHYEYYYKEALKFLRQKREDGYFDFFDHHDFNSFKGYKTNFRGKGIGFFKTMLDDAGFPDKPLIIKAGATHSGVDRLAKSKRLQEYQTEAQQAGYLLKRFIYHAAGGVKLILWGTIREDNDEHGTYSHNGLVYNGIPGPGNCNPEKESPCPDPGDGVKKLSYYTFKLLIEKLKGSNWGNIQTVIDGTDNLYLYKFTKDNRPIWVLWNDNEEERRITISGINSKEVKITEAIPRYESGEEVTNYNTAFNTEIKAVQNGRIIIALGDKPVFVEEN